MGLSLTVNSKLVFLLYVLKLQIDKQNEHRYHGKLGNVGVGKALISLT